jgi:hypothetical protein
MFTATGNECLSLTSRPCKTLTSAWIVGFEVKRAIESGGIKIEGLET